MKKWIRKNDPFAQRESQKYKHPVHSREFIIDYFEAYKKPMTVSQAIVAFGLKTPDEKEALRRRLRAMVRDGQLSRTRRNRYSLSLGGNTITGRVIGCKEGFGFITPEDGTSDILVSAYQMRMAFDGDIVKVKIIDVDRQSRREGEIVEIVEHCFKKIAGRYFRGKGAGFVEPSNKRITQDIVIPDGEENGAKSGQYVVAEIITYPTLRSYTIARIVDVIGDYLAPGMETEVAIHAYNLPHEWPDAVLSEIQEFPTGVRNKDFNGRTDLRHIPFVTIDSADARDFDDAVYAEKKRFGGWQLYVAIADVSYYVKTDTELDKSARERGTSVYFPRKVVPMLPEMLSNELCSLNPRVDRLTMVCQMTINRRGKVSRYRFYPAVICSHARLTYQKAAKFLEDDQTTEYDPDILNNLKSLHALYQVLSKLREQRGALDFELPEFRVIFDKADKIQSLKPKVRNVAHKIIEECMVLANVCAAKFLSQHKTPALYRVHDYPAADRLSDLKSFLREMGLKLGGGDLTSPKDYARLIKELQKRPDAYVIQIALLRSLSQAIYSPDNAGHFGLAFDDYTHFTSPIRRYPDLMVHRAIRSIVEKKKPDALFEEKPLKQIAEYCSLTERRADEAANEALGFLKCEYVKTKLGEVFEGIVSKVTGFGLFIELTDFYLNGLLRIASLPDDYYIFEPIKHRLVGKRTGKIYRIGDRMNVQIASVILEEQKVELLPTGKLKSSR